MDLKEFITETLISINEGVRDAIEKGDKDKIVGSINPTWIGEINWKDQVEKVDFEVAVTTTDKTGASGKAGLKVFSIADLGGDASKSFEKGFVNKVKFSIPMLLPASLRHPHPQNEDPVPNSSEPEQ